MDDVTSDDAGCFSRSAYKSFLHTLSAHLTKNNVQDIIFLTDLPGGESQYIKSPLDLFKSLELHGYLEPTIKGLQFLETLLQNINRWDISKKVQQFLAKQQTPQRSAKAVSPTSLSTSSHGAKELSATNRNPVLMRPGDYVGKRSSPSVHDDLASSREATIDVSMVALPNKQTYDKQAISNDDPCHTPTAKGSSPVGNEDQSSPSYTAKMGENSAEILSPTYDSELTMNSQTHCLSKPPIKPTVPEDMEDLEYDDFYRMEAVPRGICFILNNEQFDNEMNDEPYLDEREGSEVDAKKLQSVFTDFHFIVRMEKNLSAHETIEYFQQIANEDHSEYDCFVACILSHGCSEGFYGVDHKLVSMDDILYGFKQCKSLKEKPKLFFAQFCRGEMIDEVVRDSYAPHNVHRGNPSEADIYLAYATPPGYVSWRSKSKGTWFISKLCHWLENKAHDEDLDGIMKKVKHDVAKSYTSDYHKQVPCVSETLTKKLRFLHN